MAIVVHIYYRGINGNARKFVQEMTEKGIVKEIREEKGNLQYAYFYPAEDPESVLLIDRWEDQHALDVHHASLMMKDIIKLREKYDLHMQVERYNSDEQGMMGKDEAFIRR